MIIFKNGGYQILSGCPNEDFFGDNTMKYYVVDDESELAQKAMAVRNFHCIEDEDGNLVDIEANEPTDEEKISELKAQLSQIDGQAIRPLRAIAAGNDTEEDRNRLEALEEQAEIIRLQLAKLEENKHG